MTHMVPNISKGQVVPYFFGQTDLAASQTDVQLVAAISETGQAVDGITMPFDGAVVAIAYDLTTNKTAGVMTVGVSLDGTEVAATTQTVANSTSAGRAAFPRTTARFVAGQKLGVELTTDGSFTPITADLAVAVYVLFYLKGV